MALLLTHYGGLRHTECTAVFSYSSVMCVCVCV